MVVARFLRLNSAKKVPALGLGTFMMKGDILREALDFALSIGYRHIDTAASYGNEEEIGEVIHDRIKAGKLSRKDIFITSKIPSVCLKKDDALQSAQESLSKLCITSIDMLLIHHPWGQVKEKSSDLSPMIMSDGSGRRVISDVDFVETWSALEDLVKDGFAQNIGVSNFTIPQILRIFSNSKVRPSNVQLECHPYFQQHKIKSFCDSHDIVVSAYAPLGAVGRPTLQQTHSTKVMEDPLVLELAIKYKKSPAQILLNFLLCRGFVVLPKSSTKDRLKENFDSQSFMLTENDIKRICAIDRGLRFFEFNYVKHHPEFSTEEPF